MGRISGGMSASEIKGVGAKGFGKKACGTGFRGNLRGFRLSTWDMRLQG